MINEKDNSSGTFYSYKFDETQVSFIQFPEGEIFSVSIRNKRYPNVEFYADDPTESYYPTKISFTMPRTEISSYKDENEFNYMFQYLCNVRYELDHFFQMSEHAKLYYKHHKDKNKK